MAHKPAREVRDAPPAGSPYLGEWLLASLIVISVGMFVFSYVTYPSVPYSFAQAPAAKAIIGKEKLK